MRRVLLAGAVAAAALLANSSASAAVLLSSTFESPDVPTGGYVILGAADGWTAFIGDGIEIQDHAAGDPAANGGDQFVELDSNNNSAMFYKFAYTGQVKLDFIFSPRPSIAPTSNGINVFLNATDLVPGEITGTGGSNTSWTSYSRTFNVTAGDKLIFAATGTSDSLGGYLDNITLTAVPEPGTWALMIGGFGLAGAALRRRRAIAA